MALEFDEPRTSRLVFDEPAAPAPAPSPEERRPAGGPSSRARGAVESAQRLTDTLFSTPGARGAAVGGVSGAMLPEMTALTGMGLQTLPLGPVPRAVGRTLVEAAPLLSRFRGRSAALGATAGAAEQEVEQAARNYGFSPEAARMQGSLTGLAIGGLPITGMGARAVRTAERPYTPRTQTPEELRAAVTEAAEPATQRLAAEEQRLGREQLQREIATRKVAAQPTRQPQPETAVEKAARDEVKLISADTSEDFSRNLNLDARIRREMTAGLRRAETQQETVGGKAFNEYKAAANELQSSLPFGASPEGQQLRAYLNSQIRGGRGTLRTVSGEERADLVKIRNELFGRPRSDKPSETVGGIVSAAEQAEAAEAGRKRAVSFELVEREIRRLRNVSQRGEALGFNRIQQDEAKKAADVLEQSLNSWLARGSKGARPREIYAAASEARNRFLTEFGEAMTARQEVPFYRPGLPRGVTATAESRLSPLMFRDRDTVRFSRELVGDRLVNEFAEKYAANQLAGKNGAAVSEYLRNPANSYVYEVPGLYEKLTRYAQNLVQRELSSVQMAQLQKGLATGIETSRAATTTRVEALRKTQQELTGALAVFERTSVTEMAKTWRQSVRPKFEQSGLFSAYELDNLEREINRAALSANREGLKRTFISALGDVIRKKVTDKLLTKVGLGGGAYGLYEFWDPFGRKR